MEVKLFTVNYIMIVSDSLPFGTTSKMQESQFWSVLSEPWLRDIP